MQLCLFSAEKVNYLSRMTLFVSMVSFIVVNFIFYFWSTFCYIRVHPSKYYLNVTFSFSFYTVTLTMPNSSTQFFTLEYRPTPIKPLYSEFGHFAQYLSFQTTMNWKEPSIRFGIMTLQCVPYNKN